MQNDDIYSRLAATLFKTNVITTEDRNNAKKVLFASLYSGTIKLNKNLGKVEYAKDSDSGQMSKQY